MNVLIVGEYSGVAKNMACGFSRLKCEIDIISDGDGYKNISSASESFFLSSFIGRWSNQVFQAVCSLRKKYDLIIFLSPFVFKYPLSLNEWLYSKLIERSSRSTLVACTSDSVWWRDYDPANGRSPHLGSLNDTNGVAHRFAKDKYYKSNLGLLSVVDRVVALAPEYKFAYDAHKKNVDWVPFPYQVRSEVSAATRKPLAYHGITREGFKGSKILLHVLSQFDEGGFDTLVTKKLSHKRFVANLLESMVYLDQAYSHAPAMSALTALDLVPCVVTGVQPNFINVDYYAECPAVDVFGDMSEIYDVLRNPRLCREKLNINREFLLKYHDPAAVCHNLMCG